jgi:hypothetical protein
VHQVDRRRGDATVAGSFAERLERFQRAGHNHRDVVHSSFDGFSPCHICPFWRVTSMTRRDGGM